MRRDDVIECAAFLHTPKQALRDGLLASSPCWTAKVDGCPEAMFGLVTVSAIEGLGRPWMLGTDAIYRHGRELLRIGPWIVASFRDSSREQSNLVSAANARAIRLLRRWGYEIEDETQMIGGVLFRQFRMVR